MVTLDELARTLQTDVGLSVREQADTAIAAVARLLRRRLSIGEAAHLLTDVPAGLREFLRWTPEEAEYGITQPLKLDYDDFIADVSATAGLSLDQAEKATRLVFHTVKESLPTREVDHIASQLPKRLRVAWLEA